jgi:hypothetical protein
MPRGDQATSATPAPPPAHICLGGDEPAEVRITGAERREDRRRDSTPMREPREQQTMTDSARRRGIGRVYS